MDKIRAGIPQAVSALAADGGAAAARAIMTTDPFPKEYAVEVTTEFGSFRVGGMAKGSGMIEPRMATMLGYLTTDAAVDPVHAVARADRRVPLHVQRHHGGRRAVDERLRVRPGQRRERRRRSTKTSTRRCSRASAPWRTNSRSASSAAAKARPSWSRSPSPAPPRCGCVDGGARDRQFAAREDGGARRRSQLGPPGRRGRPIRRGLRARRRARADRLAGAVRERPAVRRARAARRPSTCRARTSRSRSTSAPAARTPPRCGPATSRPST